MEVNVTSSTILTSPISHPSDIPLTIFDRFATNNHIAVLYAFTPPTTTNVDIISGLSKTLVHFPTLTAKLSTDSVHGRPCLIVGSPDGGVLVVEATVSSKLEDHLPLTPSPDFRLLHPQVKNAKHLPTWVPLEGLLVFIPALSRDGGVDVYVSLLEKHAVRLREISHSLD